MRRAREGSGCSAGRAPTSSSARSRVRAARSGTQPLGQDTAAFAPVPLAPPDEEEEESKLRWPWIALGLTALLIALALLLLTGGEKVEVERVVGQLEPVAVDRLEDDGFEVEVDRQPDLAQVGEVIHQDPAGGSEAEEGSTVQLVVSSGPGEVTDPDRRGLLRGARRARAEPRGLRPARGHQPLRVQGRGQAGGIRPDRRGRRDQDEPAGRYAAPRSARASCSSCRAGRGRSRSRT